jgi:uncharacterized protein
MNTVSNIPDAALAQHVAVLGKTGSGKTFAAKGAIVEPLLTLGRRVGIVDPTSAWWGLRSSKNGKGPGFPILVLGGDHGDLPLPALGGAAVARLLVEQGVNLVADTSALTVGERTRWFIDFAGALYRLNRAPLHLVIDEAHNFAPQGKVPDPDTGKMLHAANTLASGGRSRGIRLVMITQRPQKLHKDALTSADTLIAMRVLAPHDRLAVEDWIKGCGDMAAGKEVLNSLAGLQRGEGWVWYPEGGFLKRMKFPAIETFDSSATPTDGHAIAALKGAAEIDLTEISAALADAVKEAESNNPKLLRARIAELERASKGSAAAPDALDLARREGRDEGAREGYAAGLRAVQPIADRLGTLSTAVSETIEGFQQDLRRLAGAVLAPQGSHNTAPARPARETYRSPGSRDGKAKGAPKPRHNGNSGSSEVSRPQQRILNALAWMESVRIPVVDKTQLALLSDQSPTSGGYFNNLGTLRSAGLISYPTPSKVALTDAGRMIAETVDTPSTSAALQDQVMSRLPRLQAAILRKLIHIYPREISKADLAEAAEQSPTSGGYFNNLGRLRTLGLIDYPTPGKVAAQPVLFLE